MGSITGARGQQLHPEQSLLTDACLPEEEPGLRALARSVPHPNVRESE